MTPFSRRVCERRPKRCSLHPSRKKICSKNADTETHNGIVTIADTATINLRQNRRKYSYTTN